MKALGAFADHFNGATTLCTCFDLSLADGAVQRFTDHPAPVDVGGVVYTPDASFDLSEIDQGANMGSDPVDLRALLGAAGGISREDLEAGRYDHAAFRVFVVDYSDTAAGELELQSGRLGRVTIEDGQATAEGRGVLDRLRRPVGRSIQGVCDAELGDSRCGVDLAPLTHVGTVTAVGSRYEFTAEALGLADNLLQFGALTWTSGANVGRSVEVRSNSLAGVVVLAQPMVRGISVGDAFSVVEGCDHTVSACKTRFGNLINFRGFPFVPGSDVMRDRPDAK